METVIPIADLQPIYSVADVDRARGDGAAKRNESVTNFTVHAHVRQWII